MNNKAEYIKKYGEVAYIVLEKMRSATRIWCEDHPDRVRDASHEGSRTGGKYYKRRQTYARTGIQGERNKIRTRHANRWRPYKQIIAPDSHCHHNWVPKTSKYTGLALVEADQHMHGIIKVIRILEGKINVFTEREISDRGEL